MHGMWKISNYKLLSKVFINFYCTCPTNAQYMLTIICFL